MSIGVIFLIVALILAILAAVNVPSPRVSLLAAAFAFYLLSLLVGAGKLIG